MARHLGWLKVERESVRLRNSHAFDQNHCTVLVALFWRCVSCSRNPEVAKSQYLESGNKYFERGKYKQARIMYKDAIQKDRLFGPAYYKLGLTAIKLESSE